MNRNLLLCLLGILECLLVSIVAREAIIGGQLTEHPIIEYQVTIMIANHPKMCGGGIINALYILTAAQCVFTENARLIGRDVSVLTETYDLLEPGRVTNVHRIFVPRRTSNSPDDIAVLRLRNALRNVMNDVSRLQIPRNISMTYFNKEAMIAGFGYDTMDYRNNKLIGQYSDNQLRFANVIIHNNTQCQHDHPRRRITAKQLCARVVPFDPATRRYGVCNGDGGSPLVLRNMDQLIVVGVLSATAPGCSEATSSGIYTRVTQYRQFVYNSMRNHVTRNMFVFDI